jgi:hypothetical protein
MKPLPDPKPRNRRLPPDPSKMTGINGRKPPNPIEIKRAAAKVAARERAKNPYRYSEAGRLRPSTKFPFKTLMVFGIFIAVVVIYLKATTG